MKNFVLLLLVSGCAGQSVEAENELAKAASEAREIQASPEYKNAEAFDRYLKGQFSKEELQAAKKECAEAPRGNIFCPSYALARSFTAKIADANRIQTAPEPKVVTPSEFKWTGKTIQGWRHLRREKMPSLLKGLETLPMESLQLIGAFALKEKRCPNNVAIAVGATLEDSLPDKANPQEIARYYEHGGRCSAQGSADKENFYTRAGLLLLLANSPSEAAKILAKVRPADAFSGRALYWLYRSRLLSRDKEGAEQAKSRLIRMHPFSFHATLLIHQGDDHSVDATSVIASEKRSKRSPKANPFIAQVEELAKYSFEASANVLAEWTLERYKRLETPTRLYLAELGSPKLKVISVSDMLLRKPSLACRHTLELAYPKPYFNFFEKQSDADPYLLLAIARKESQFDPMAVSSANAQGLLQIQPATAAKTSGDGLNLLDPERNIQVGARYVSQLRGRLGQLPLVLAAYNAGEEPLGRWQKRYRTSDPVLFMDLIPYRETRDYVGYVLANYHWYYRVHSPTSKDPFKDLIPSELAISK